MPADNSQWSRKLSSSPPPSGTSPSHPDHNGGGPSFRDIPIGKSSAGEENTREELVNIKRELERVQKEARFYRKELEQSNYNLQQAIGDNRVYAKNIHDLQSANARLKDHLLSSQHELANVQRMLDDAKIPDDARGRELQATQAMPINSKSRQNSGGYTSGLNFQ